MWNTIEGVARFRNLNAEALRKFALDNKERYSIVQERGAVEVNTWHVDSLVEDFKKQSGCVKP